MPQSQQICTKNLQCKYILLCETMRYFRSTYCKQLTANKADANTYVSVKSTVTILLVFYVFYFIKDERIPDSFVPSLLSTGLLYIKVSLSKYCDYFLLLPIFKVSACLHAVQHDKDFYIFGVNNVGIIFFSGLHRRDSS